MASTNLSKDRSAIYFGQVWPSAYRKYEKLFGDYASDPNRGVASD